MSRDSSQTYSLADRLEYWESLTWDDLNRWAGVGSVTKGRTYQRGGRVKQLAISDDGWLLATVQGSASYSVSVWIESAGSDEGRLKSECSCPIGGRCKHAIAVIAEYLDAIAKGTKLPRADQNDPRWEKLARLNEPFGSDDQDDLESDRDDFDELDQEQFEIWGSRRRLPARAAAPKTAVGGSRSQWDERIAADIAQKSVDELRAIVTDCVRRFPDLRKEFQERIELSSSDLSKLVAQARKAIDEASAQPGWTRHWSDESFVPDYSRVKSRLQKLAEAGWHDALVNLGRDLLQQGTSQVEQTDDEGETAEQIRDCLSIVFQSLAKSKLSPEKKLLYAIDACLDDDYDLIDESVSQVLVAKWSKAVWSSVAAELRKRLDKLPSSSGTEFSSQHDRDGVSNWLITALEKAGRSDEIRPLLEEEAPRTHSYQRLVGFLINEKDLAAAEHWAREGIQQTLKQWPGIASSLRQSLCQIAMERKQWDIVAAHAAAPFFTRPSRTSLQELLDAATKAGLREVVQAQAIQFLETGESPLETPVKKTPGGSRSRRESKPAWPLPILPELEDHPSRPVVRRQGPYLETLIELAIHEDRPDDVLKWYDQVQDQPRNQSRYGYGWGSSLADQVAEAVRKSHPERALQILKRQVDGDIPTDQGAYQRCVDYLRKLKPIYESLNRKDEWSNLVADIRTKNKRRRNFVELLDQLNSASIVDARRGRAP